MLAINGHQDLWIRTIAVPQPKRSYRLGVRVSCCYWSQIGEIPFFLWSSGGSPSCSPLETLKTIAFPSPDPAALWSCAQPRQLRSARSDCISRRKPQRQVSGYSKGSYPFEGYFFPWCKQDSFSQITKFGRMLVVSAFWEGVEGH